MNLKSDDKTTIGLKSSPCGISGHFLFKGTNLACPKFEICYKIVGSHKSFSKSYLDVLPIHTLDMPSKEVDLFWLILDCKCTICANVSWVNFGGGI